MSSAIKTPAFQAKASNILNEDGSSIYSAGEWSFKNASAVTGFHVDASGNVGIGTTSLGATFHIKKSVDATICKIEGPTANLVYQEFNNLAYLWNQGSSFLFGTSTNHSLLFGTNNTERMRLDASGNLHVGRTGLGGSTAGTTLGLTPNGAGYNEAVSASTTTTIAIWYMNRQSSDGTAIEFRRANSKVGSITVNSSNTQYNQSASDYRLKEAIAPLEGGLAKVCAMKPVSFKWKESQKEDYGFIAHELQAIIPEAISGEKDAVDAEGNPEYQAIFPAPAQMVASLVAAIQELKAELDEAKAKIAALESK